MVVNLTDSELKSLVKEHVSGLISVPQERLKVTFTRRQTMTDTSIEILKENEPKSPMEPLNRRPVTETEDAQEEPAKTETSTLSSILK